MPKYQIICKACGTIHGYTDRPIVEGLSAKCSVCGMERIAIEPVPEEIFPQMDFDVFVSNKRTAVNRHQGTTLSVEDLKDKTDEQIREVFIERIAKALGAILKNPENVKELLNNGGKLE